MGPLAQMKENSSCGSSLGWPTSCRTLARRRSRISSKSIADKSPLSINTAFWDVISSGQRVLNEWYREIMRVQGHPASSKEDADIELGHTFRLNVVWTLPLVSGWPGLKKELAYQSALQRVEGMDIICLVNAMHYCHWNHSHQLSHIVL